MDIPIVGDMQGMQQPRAEQNAPVSLRLGEAVNRIEILGEPVQHPFAAFIKVAGRIVEPPSISPRAGQHLVLEPFPLGSPVVPKAPRTQEEDFLIPVPEFAERRGRQEHTDLRLFPSRRSGTRLARHFSDTVRQEKDEEFRSILL